MGTMPRGLHADNTFTTDIFENRKDSFVPWTIQTHT